MLEQRGVKSTTSEAACEAPLEGIYGACTKSVFPPLETPQIAVARIMDKDNMQG